MEKVVYFSYALTTTTRHKVLWLYPGLSPAVPGIKYTVTAQPEPGCLLHLWQLNLLLY